MFLHTIRALRAIRNLIFAAALAVVPFLIASDNAGAQVPGIMSPGDAIVTGFSGVTEPLPPFPSGDPLDEIFIDLNGLSMQIQRLQPAGPPAGQLIASPTVFATRAWDVGQVFSVALDDWPNPNIFLAATSAYGLHIVTPDSDGDGRPERVTAGQPGAQWMDGQWGPGGAPGSIWRVDGTTGAMTLFTTIGANAGPGLGAIVYDRGSRQLFASDLDTGLIYRLDWTGFIVDTFDHGLTARPMMGLPAVADDNTFMSIQNPAFDSLNPATWGYTPPERRVRGMAVHGGRLFYAVAAGPQVWSVGIRLDGTFANDARWELDVVGYASQNEVSDMLFDAQGRMLLAQRGAQQNSYDYSVFAEPMLSSVLRYRREIPDDPATPGTWVPLPDEYAIGFRPNGHNTTGGIALGYGYNAAGQMRTGACNEYLWTTGESLRDYPPFAAVLAAGGPATVHGLQGNDRRFVRPQNDPPFQSYFTDYDGQFVDPQNQGHLGDVEIWQPCIAADGGYYYPQIPPYFPPPTYVPPADPFNLTLFKAATPYDCIVGGLGYICNYTVRVTNTGPSWYWGPITVEDWLPQDPPGAAVTFSPSPPWACIGTGPSSYSCAYPPVFLWPGDSVDLGVEVQLPAATDLCFLHNVAALSWWPGPGDANPLDDWGFATAKVPNPECDPPEDEEETNLKIEKQLAPCLNIEPDAECFAFSITVTNTGPGIYSDDIVITDALSVLVPIWWVLDPPWTCVSAGPVHTCTHPAADLPDGVGGGELHPGNSVGLIIGGSVPVGVFVEGDVCQIDNEVTITSALGAPKNTDPTDDTANASKMVNHLPHCQPEEPPRSDLEIFKRGYGCQYIEGEQPPATFAAPAQGGWACYFGVSIANHGPDDFDDVLAFKDTTNPPLTVSGPAPFCTPDGGGGLDCISAPGTVPIGAGMTRGPVPIVVFVPDDGSVCEVTNTATIVEPAGGSPTNTNPANDSASATLPVPSPWCDDVALTEEPPMPPPEEAPVCPIESRMPDGGCCPPGERWTGRACSGDTPPTTPPPPPPPPPTSTPPPPPPPVTDRPPQVCPPGMVGTPPNCRPQQCPPGTTGTPPNCVQTPPQVCPPGMVGTPPNCRPQQCPPGTTGTPPSCVQIPVAQPCPQGSVGTPPNCRCPDGFIGTPPLCVRIPTTQPPSTTVPTPQTCPPNSVGTPPKCTCARGFTGTPPNCVPTTQPPTAPSGPTIMVPPPTTGAPPTRTLEPTPQLQLVPLQVPCPPGTTGTWPNCQQVPR